MSKKLTSTKLKMAALGNNMLEIGKEIYINPPNRGESKDKTMEKTSK